MSLVENHWPNNDVQHINLMSLARRRQSLLPADVLGGEKLLAGVIRRQDRSTFWLPVKVSRAVVLQAPNKGHRASQGA